MTMLEQLSVDVVNSWETSNLAATVSVSELSKQLELIVTERVTYEGAISSARAGYASDDIEIDEEPVVAVADDGVWVSAWVWVPCNIAG